MRSRIFFKTLAAFVLVIAAATLTLDISIRRAWEESLYSEIERSLREKTLMFAGSVQADSQHAVQKTTAETAKAADARATVIDSTGRVLADSEADPAHMENHSTRPEFAEALRGRVGISTRGSHTIGIDFLYIAAPVNGGAVRLAYPLQSIAATTRKIRRTLLFSSILAILLAMLLAAIAAQSITRRLQSIVRFAETVAEGDLSARLDERSSDEIAQVAKVLDATAHKLEESFAAVETSRRELEAVLNGMQEAVIAVGADTRVKWANQRMERLLGVRQDSALVETVRDPELLATVRTAMTTRAVCSARATSIVPGRMFQVTAAPMPAGGAVAVLHDLTDIERVEKTRRDFIANVSHELRTPLTSIQGYAETLLDGPPESGSREFLEIIRKNAARMTRLTEDLLVLARVESGEQHFDLKPLAPSELLRDAQQNFSETGASAVLLEIDDRSTRLVGVDRDAIFQVFTNLIDNALKYAASGGRIVIGARDVEAGVEFFVRDFGPGISSEHLSRLFERFYRVDTARSRESGGTGLGLAIAKHIVLAHGGTIRVESELHHGSTFAFMLRTAEATAHA
ncbi:MAG TPA: ATP-binding protein [Clostridia bacterium]|nr:ATP-binding protein [Clostridia bacterium]